MQQLRSLLLSLHTPPSKTTVPRRGVRVQDRCVGSTQDWDLALDASVVSINKAMTTENVKGGGGGGGTRNMQVEFPEGESATFMAMTVLPTLPRYLKARQVCEVNENVQSTLDRHGHILGPDKKKPSYRIACVKPKI